MHAAAVATELRTMLDADDMHLAATGSRFAGTEDFLVTLQLPGGWTAQVPVTITAGGQLVGVDADEVLTTCEQPLPAGFRWWGRSLWGDALVGWHDGADVAVLLTRTNDAGGPPGTVTG